MILSVGNVHCRSPVGIGHNWPYAPYSSDLDYLYNHIIYKPYDMKTKCCAEAVILVCDYVRTTRPDIIKRYKNGQCIKVTDHRSNNIINQNRIHEDMEVDDYKSN